MSTAGVDLRRSDIHPIWHRPGREAALPFLPPQRPHPQDSPLRPGPSHHQDGNRPQIQFNDGSVWHDLGPVEGEAALNAGPWFPYLELFPADRLPSRAQTCMKRKLAAGQRWCSDAAADEQEACTLPPHQKARHAAYTEHCQ